MKLICPECRRENEPERIYCHDCGARLDRSVLAKAKVTTEKPEETQRRLRSLLDGRGVIFRHRLVLGLKVLVGAILLAAFVQMFRAPDLPEKSDASGEFPTQINIELEDAAMAAPGGPALRYSEEQVNAYLAYRVKSKNKVLSNYLQFERAVAGLEDGFARLTVERSLLGFSVFTTVTFSPRIENATVSANGRGGKIGRLPVHPAVMEYCGFLFSDLLSVLDRERKSIARLGGIELQPQRVFFAPKRAPQVQPPPQAQPPPPEAQPTPETPATPAGQ